ncbi:hypothetical protein POM88_037300 [Heracleum sosnowskyi]|uniref:Uncharacterized protein n=1 Tax=Heracleum sosnowskyi TaxID=360622 RepID=A0AAD8MGI4_9APIA|nr:hypothetical protein POM88_037300 [Heracleum sosnowskyi]
MSSKRCSKKARKKDLMKHINEEVDSFMTEVIYEEVDSFMTEVTYEEVDSFMTEVIDYYEYESCITRINRKIRARKKLKKKAKREEALRLAPLISRGGLLYMFVRLSYPRGTYFLYRIHDPLEHSDKVSEYWEPLLVFHPDVLPAGFCALVHIGPFLYFVGEKPCDVFKILKTNISYLVQRGCNSGSKYLRPLKPRMQGPKKKPLVFVANDDLYVISRECCSNESHEFEVYSPLYDCWRNLSPGPKGYGKLKSHVVLDDIVYFATAPKISTQYQTESVLSYNLTDGRWSVLSTSPENGIHRDLGPAFDPPVEIISDMIFGAFDFTVAASPHTRYSEFVKDSFMRPTLAPDHDFYAEFNRGSDYIRDDEQHRSRIHDMTTLHTKDDQNILCCVSYGNKPFDYRTYALFTFFKILGCIRSTTPEPLEEEVARGGDDFCTYARQVEAGNVVKNYFTSEFLHRKLVRVRCSELITCFSY